MKYCIDCGNQLFVKELKNEGMVPFCDHCQKYQFPVFNTAVSMIVLNKEKDKMLFIKQYGKDRNIFVAGYVNKGENAEDAVARELMEEVGLVPTETHFLKSYYWEKSNTLILNYLVIVQDMEVHSNEEVDSYLWVKLEDATEVMAKGSLVEISMEYFLANKKALLL